MTQENTDVAQVRSASVRKASLELNLVTDMKSDKKYFYIYSRSKKNTRGNSGQLLNGVGNPVVKKKKKKHRKGRDAQALPHICLYG